MDRVTQLKVISEFLNFEMLKWKLANESSEKDYAELYRQVKLKGKLPSLYIKIMSESRVCRHFWTDDEMLSFKKKWALTE